MTSLQQQQRQPTNEAAESHGPATAAAQVRPLDIAGRAVGPGRPTFVIAEIGVNHDGSLARALELVKLASDCGADRWGSASRGSERGRAGVRRCTTTAPRPARRPPRTAAAKSVLRRSRCVAASTDYLCILA